MKRIYITPTSSDRNPPDHLPLLELGVLVHQYNQSPAMRAKVIAECGPWIQDLMERVNDPWGHILGDYEMGWPKTELDEFSFEFVDVYTH